MISTVEELPTWDLSDLYAGIDDPQLTSDMQAVQEQALEFERHFKGTIAREDLSPTHLRAAHDA
ncbi:MAG: hypothetical protein ACKVJG_19595 [Candidatus Latescibacterota bacterium]|jgi:oligoendopeptidase F|tara:strand:- start:232 stop:423 length:192 start_codon:yes stop_codon:yes gene_type:complete